MNYPSIDIRRSNGHTRSGKKVFYIRPLQECSNRSRRITGWSFYELQEKIDRVCDKWYSPMVYYKIEGNIIGSNSKINALKEYWRICNIEDSKAKKLFEVKQVQA